jgi:DNA-binding transcriptional LysR family regulator
MGLSSLHLDAFYAAAKALNFSQAAKELHITQSALSQRIKSLEEELGLTLFVRMPRGVALTEAGTRLLRYCQARNSLEKELLEELTGTDSGGLGGQLRIGGFSSVVRSVLVPALSPLLRENPNVQAHFQNAEMRELPEMLLTGQVDFIVTDCEVHRADLISESLGEEEYVMVDSRDFPVPHEIYLDHDPEDRITAQFFAHNSKGVHSYKRSFMDETYAICDAAALGLGKAIVARHLIRGDDRLVIVDGYRSMFVPVMLHYLQHPFYTALQKRVLEELKSRCPTLLAQNSEPNAQ